jgi:hypothetical protein
MVARSVAPNATTDSSVVTTVRHCFAKSKCPPLAAFCSVGLYKPPAHGRRCRSAAGAQATERMMLDDEDTARTAAARDDDRRSRDATAHVLTLIQM